MEDMDRAKDPTRLLLTLRKVALGVKYAVDEGACLRYFGTVSNAIAAGQDAPHAVHVHAGGARLPLGAQANVARGRGARRLRGVRRDSLLVPHGTVAGHPPASRVSGCGRRITCGYGD